MTKPTTTPEASMVLATLMKLSPAEVEWVLVEYWAWLDPDERQHFRGLFEGRASVLEGEAKPEPFEQARERLLEDTAMSAGEKVLLAALHLLELHGVDDFQGRQITETLRSFSNPVKNITAALNGLIAKGEAEVANPARVARHAHKRYQLTSDGVRAAESLARGTKAGG